MVKIKKIGSQVFIIFSSTFAILKIWYHLREGLDKKLMKFEC
jgi:hypothetical protein